MPKRHMPIVNTEETTLILYQENQAILQKIKDASYTIVSIWG